MFSCSAVCRERDEPWWINMKITCTSAALSLFPIPHMVLLKRGIGERVRERGKKNTVLDFQKEPLGIAFVYVPVHVLVCVFCVFVCACAHRTIALCVCVTIWMCAYTLVCVCWGWVVRGVHCVGVLSSFLTEPPVACIRESFVLLSISYSALQ